MEGGGGVEPDCKKQRSASTTPISESGKARAHFELDQVMGIGPVRPPPGRTQILREKAQKGKQLMISLLKAPLRRSLRASGTLLVAFLSSLAEVLNQQAQLEGRALLPASCRGLPRQGVSPRSDPTRPQSAVGATEAPNASIKVTSSAEIEVERHQDLSRSSTSTC